MKNKTKQKTCQKFHTIVYLSKYGYMNFMSYYNSSTESKTRGECKLIIHLGNTGTLSDQEYIMKYNHVCMNTNPMYAVVQYYSLSSVPLQDTMFL